MKQKEAAADSKEKENKEISKEIEATRAEKKAKEAKIKQVQKEINEKFQKFTNSEKDARSIQSQILELQTMDSGVIKLTNELISEHRKYEETKRNLHEEQQIFVGQLVKKGLEERTLLG